MAYAHTPVLLKEVLEQLVPKPGENFIDATLGGGGYSQAILNKIGPKGKLLAIDLDKDAISNFKTKNNDQNVILHHGNFAQIDQAVKHHNFGPVSGIVADLGLSSYELDQAGRGMSFQKDEPLDMRFNLSQPDDAKFVINSYQENRLIKIFQDFGEEKFSRQIAKKILAAREKQPIKHTDELFQIIQDALPKPVKHKAADSARRIFQAIRIEVNQELQSLAEFLPKAFDLLPPGGRLSVVSFHSLEDRQVKQFFKSLELGCVCPPDFPQCLCGKNPKGKTLTKKPVTASPEELKRNPRAKPAKLRTITKL